MTVGGVSNVGGLYLILVSLSAEKKGDRMDYGGCGTLSSPCNIIDRDNSKQSSLFSNVIKNSVGCIVSE